MVRSVHLQLCFAVIAFVCFHWSKSDDTGGSIDTSSCAERVVAFKLDYVQYMCNYWYGDYKLNVDTRVEYAPKDGRPKGTLLQKSNLTTTQHNFPDVLSSVECTTEELMPRLRRWQFVHVKGTFAVPTFGDECLSADSDCYYNITTEMKDDDSPTMPFERMKIAYTHHKVRSLTVDYDYYGTSYDEDKSHIDPYLEVSYVSSLSCARYMCKFTIPEIAVHEWNDEDAIYNMNEQDLADCELIRN